MRKHERLQKKRLKRQELEAKRNSLRNIHKLPGWSYRIAKTLAAQVGWAAVWSKIYFDIITSISRLRARIFADYVTTDNPILSVVREVSPSFVGDTITAEDLVFSSKQ